MPEHVVGKVDDIPVGERRVVKVGRLEIGIFNIGGTFYALPNLCPHQFGPLCTGKISGAIVANRASNFYARWEYDGEVVCCPWHGLEFNVTSGRAIAYQNLKLRQYPVRVDGDEVKVVV